MHNETRKARRGQKHFHNTHIDGHTGATTGG